MAPMTLETRNALKAAAISALFAFLGTFSLTALDFLQEVSRWASTSGAEPLPGLAVLGYGAVSAAVAAATGLFNFLYRLWKPVTASYPSTSGPGGV